MTANVESAAKTGDRGREQEEEAVGARRHDLFLHEELQDVGDGPGARPNGPTRFGPGPVLDEGGAAALDPDRAG